MMDTASAEQDVITIDKQPLVAPGNLPDTEGNSFFVYRFTVFFQDHMGGVKNWCFRAPQLGIADIQRDIISLAFRNGFISISGIAFAQILPAVSRFSKDNKREEMRQRVFEKLSAYLEKYKDMGGEEE